MSMVTEAQKIAYEIETISLPSGIEFLEIAGQRLFPHDEPHTLSFWLLKRGQKELAPKLFDGGKLEYGLRVFPGGWALMGFKIEDGSAIDARRLIAANLPTLEAAQ